ncbi:hypothetical protein Bca4012_031163 [Brassica carinata]
MSDGKEKIGCFMEALESFFISGINGDDVPQSNGDIISLYQTEYERAKVYEDKMKARLRYAYALALSPKSSDVQHGIALLEESLEDCDEPHEALLVIALGYLKIGYYEQSSATFETCIQSHLLRIACFFSQDLSLNNPLRQITMELHHHKLVSDGVLALASQSIQEFNVAFDHVLESNIVNTLVPGFWKLASKRTRYLQNFQQLEKLGKGGFATVYLCKNYNDGREYALKLIKPKKKTKELNNAMLREVQALSGLQHKHVVRYYQAWIEQVVKCSGETPPDSEAEDSVETEETEETEDSGLEQETHEKEIEYCLYIQMEYCPRTLRDILDVKGYCVDEVFAWKTINQILDGVSYIHEKKIIHRDLTPRNIFFDSDSDVKIGDFGLAKFLDKDEAGNIRTTSKSSVESQYLGTALYLAPEIVNGSEDIDQKVDIYSLGIVFLEIWHPFETAMERHVVLTKLRNEGILPAALETKHPILAEQLRLMVSDNPDERPTVGELRTGFGVF